MKRVYFHCRDNPRAYQDDVVVLGEGLRELGIEVFGNCNYWQRTLEPDSWLVRHDPRIRPEDCDIVVVSYVWARWLDNDFKVVGSPLPAALFAPGRRYRTAFIDLDDGYLTASFRPEFRAFDVIFRAKYNRRCFHPANHRPWALGLSARVLASTSDAPPWAARRPEVLVNFNASHPYVHPARALIEPPFLAALERRMAINRTRDDLKVPPAGPWDRLMWTQTQQRHSRSYYDRLGGSQAVAAFCGEFIPPLPSKPPYLAGGGRARLWRRIFDLLALADPRPLRLIQWDSWRFWEGMAAGCLVFNFDLPHYGVELPVMPQNFVHYVAVRPETLAAALDRLDADPGLAERIAAQGRAWALEHYSPRALARRFLAALGAQA